MHLKSLLLFLVITLSTQGIKSQNCTDLFVSEIIFGKVDVPLTNDNPVAAIFNNYAIEIYNPTDESINLSSYQFDLYTETSEVTTIPLNGVIAGKSTFVVANPASSSNVTSAANSFSSDLILEDYVLLQLTKNGLILDVIGKEGATLDVDNIDIDAVLNDPSYLEDLDINLKSIEGLGVRRRPGVKGGVIEFVVQDILGAWEIYPHFFTEHLGEHLNVCTQGILEIRWDDNTGNGVALAAEDEEFLLSLEGIIEGLAILDGNVDSDITMNARPVNEPPIGFDAAQQGFLEDFDVADPFGNFDNTFEVNAFATGSLSVPVCEVFDDNDPEPTEVASFRLEFGDIGSETVFIGFPDVLYVSILDDDGTATVDLTLQKEIQIFPAVADNHVSITTTLTDLQLEGVFIYSLTGQQEQYIPLSKTNQAIIDVSGFSRGYHSLLIYTNQGLVAKRFIKM